jgi:hypothetical protein
MTLKDILAEALRAVEEAEIPGELREIAFAKAIDLAADPQPVRARAAGASHRQQVQEALGDDADGLQRIASKLKLDREVVSHVYYISSDAKGLEVVVSPTRLPSRFGPAIKELALLVAAGRQAAGIDAEWTAAEEIRKVCEHFKRNDPSNFATYIKQMEDVFSIRGTAYKREVRMTMPAWEQATALVARLANVGQ